MISLVLTGGVASGKSTLAKLLMDRVEGLAFFDSDEAVAALLTEESVIESIAKTFGEDYVVDGSVDRPALRELVFSDRKSRQELESILHPLVRARLGAASRKGLREGAKVMLADIPLFFETGMRVENRGVLVTACPREVQHERLTQREGINGEIGDKIINSQWSWSRKVEQADYVFWTSGNQDFLTQQVDVFIKKLEIWVASDKTPNPANFSFDIPEKVQLSEFRNRPMGELVPMAQEMGIKVQGDSKSQLIFDLTCKLAEFGSEIVTEGVIEQAKETFGMIRDPKRSFRPETDDIYIGKNLLNDYGLRVGNLVEASVRPPKGRDNYLSVNQLTHIESRAASQFEAKTEFDDLTSEFPNDRFHLEPKDSADMAVRLVDLIAPLGKGQRGLIVAPPRGGKTILLKQIARAIRANDPDCELIVLLLDERPEEVTDFEETVTATVYSSTFDESSKRHAQVSDLVLERAKRLVEQGKDVVILLDSLTRLARGYNNAASGGPIGSGGVNPGALAKARKFFGAARNVAEGGSLTILATCLVETENRMDDVIFEELKGTGNMEIRLDRDLAERRIYPAIHIPQSGTRNDDRLYHKDELPRIMDLRRQLAAMPVGEAVEVLMNQLKKTQNNAEFLLKGLK
ncbi:MAG: transcription termination factor Rho [Verrucomicrobiota bacterium JB023]|nr:transcription termination factor Rho [Verrucomicrobiota bacterium JB023]